MRSEGRDRRLPPLFEDEQRRCEGGEGPEQPSGGGLPAPPPLPDEAHLDAQAAREGGGERRRRRSVGLALGDFVEALDQAPHHAARHALVGRD